MNNKQQITEKLVNFYESKNDTYSNLTVINHATRITKILSLLDVKQDIFNIENIKDAENIMKILKSKYTNISTLKSYVKSLAIFIQLIDTENNHNDLLKSYRDIMLLLNNDIDNKQLKIIKTKKLSITPAEILKLKVHYENETKKYIDGGKITVKIKHIFQKHLLFCLYSGLYIPPPRNDFGIMKITNNYEEEKDKMDFNYYDNKNHMFIFNKFKNSKIKGSTSYEINNDLVIIIQKYMKVMNYNDGDFLFKTISSGKTNNKQFKDCNLGQLIQKVFNGSGVTTLRKVYLTKEFDKLQEVLRKLTKTTNMMMNTNNIALKHYIHENTKDL